MTAFLLALTLQVGPGYELVHELADRPAHRIERMEDGRTRVVVTRPKGTYAPRAGNRRTIVIPPGETVFDEPIVLASDTELFLSDGAVLRADPASAKFPNRGRKDSLQRPLTWLVATEPGATNVAVRGAGIIDARGTEMFRRGCLASAVVANACDGFTMEGVTVVDGNFWTVTPVRSRHVVLKDVAVCNDVDDLRENDAFDVCECSDVRVTNCLGVSRDDSFSTKTWSGHRGQVAAAWHGKAQPLSDVTFEDCLAWTRCAAYKVGDGIVQPQRNVRFRRSQVYDCRHAVRVSCTYGAAEVSGIVFEDISIRSFTGRGPTCGWLDLCAPSGGLPADVTLRRISVGSTPAVRVAKWRGNRAAAVSLTFDDGLVDHYEIVYPTLEKAGFKGTFWMIGRKVTNHEKEVGSPMMTWDNAREMQAHGHEIANHGWSHVSWNKDHPERFAADMETNDVALVREMGRRSKTFCYPGNGISPEAIEIASKGRVGTRTFQDGLGRRQTPDDFVRMVEKTVERGDWRVFMTHGIVQGFDAWGDAKPFQAMVDRLAAMKDRVWVGTFEAVASYSREREAVKLDERRLPDGAWSVRPKLEGLDTGLFTEPLTLVVPFDLVRGAELKATQAGRNIPAVRTDDGWIVDIDPNGGEVVFSDAAAQGFASPFSPQEGTVAPVERPLREEICLNGKWRFQPVPLPEGYKFEKGVVPELPLPAPDRWEAVPLKVPSPWNANSWGCGTDVGEGTKRPYDPDSLYYPSYPESWRHVRMGWLARTFALKAAPRADRRVLLHFESVAGDCRVRVNGRDAGAHFDKYLPFDLDVTDLVKPGENTLEVGIRDLKLFNRRESDYTKMVQPYPAGSNTDGLVGLWQDVSLVTVPAVRVDDVFVKPEVSADRLTLELRLRNDSATARKVRPSADVFPWINGVSGDPMRAEAPKWKLGAKALSFRGEAVTVPARGEATVTLSTRVGEKLRKWTPDAPNLSAAVVSLGADAGTADRKYVRFGWREFTIRDRDLLLNGERIELRADILHPFGAYSFSSRFVRAWYTMIKDMHGNAVRPHAQVYPRCYLDLADEMGLCVLDETAVFGSSVNANFKMEEFWTRWVDHYRGLVMRDRNHPSVFGWSVGNEMFAIALLNKIPEGPEKKGWYDRIAEIGLMARTWDPTRAFITCDGDQDLDGKLPTWSKHFGHHPRDVEKECKGVRKPLVVGENGGTYYARPADLYRLGAEAAYRDYAGRNDALGTDVYSNYVCMARGRLAYWSASETAWFGLEPLPLGYTDHTRLPGRTDGIRFADVPDGTWGPQVERMPPYVTTFNPGFDPALPLYRPLAMFHAHKAAMDPRGPQPCAWDRYPAKPVRPAPPKDVRPGVNRLVFVSDAAELAEANRLTGGRLSLTDRTATQLVRGSETDPAVASFTVDELYFAEAGEKDEQRRIARHGLDGTAGGEVLLAAANTDWSLFNRRPENAKVAAITCYEQLRKPAGAVLVAYPSGEGRVFVTTVERNPQTVRGRHFLRRLCANIGVAPPFDENEGSDGTRHEHDLLLDGPKD